MARPDRRQTVVDPRGALHGSLQGPRANDNDVSRSESREPREPRTPPESLEQRLEREEREGREARERELGDLVDVPAAVVCLVCGEADCVGCEDRDLSRSGIVSLIAWERPGLPVLTRLWSTARSTTRDADAFFELLPDGPVVPALRFAAICELLAAGAMLLLALPFAAVLAPGWLSHVALDPQARNVALRVVFLGLPAFAGFLVLLHAVHALAIDRGAARSGARRAPSRALRFGLYACGWDLLMGPLGAVVVAGKEGAAAALGLLDLAGVPGRATRAFLRGCYRLEGERAQRALATASAGVALTTLVGAVVVIAVVVALTLA